MGVGDCLYIGPSAGCGNPSGLRAFPSEGVGGTGGKAIQTSSPGWDGCQTARAYVYMGGWLGRRGTQPPPVHEEVLGQQDLERKKCTTSHLPLSLEDGVMPNLEQEDEPEHSAPQSKAVLTDQWSCVEGHRPIPTGQIWTNRASEESGTVGRIH